MRMPLKMRLYYGIGRHLPFLKIRPPQVDRQAALTLRPGRNSLLSWEKRDSGETVLTVPQNQKVGRMTRWLAKWMNVPNARHVELDEVGGYVWELCDGHHTIESIVQKTGRQYKMNRREAEVSVTMFLQMLHERNFIGFYKKVGKKS
ncbi:MAG TPA: PqqD family protein [Chthonomonadaceae bacterium]|nr:PqqD family protein [Chthonomonadaceae bacterium]